MPRTEFDAKIAENPMNAPYNRYPDPLQWTLKEKIAKMKHVRPGQIMLGNGSDEPIDLVFRVFCEPKEDNVVAIEPTYGMYKVCADINNVEYRKAFLNDDFTLDAERVLQAIRNYAKGWAITAGFNNIAEDIEKLVDAVRKILQVL